MTSTETRVGEQTLLSIRDLHVSYGRAAALHGVSLSARRGEIVAVLGRNGVGKTTLLRGICGAGVQRRGRIALTSDTGTEKDITSLPTHRLARMGIAWIPDDRRMFPGMTVRHALELAAKASHRNKPGIGAAVDGIVESVPLIGSLQGRNGDQLSGGEQQIVAIARALAMNPQLILMDEPSEGLAPRIVDEIGVVVRSLSEDLGVTVLLAEQNLEFALRICDRVVMLQAGEAVYESAVTDPAFSKSTVENYMAI